jgi:hypothetical protein
MMMGKIPVVPKVVFGTPPITSVEFAGTPLVVPERIMRIFLVKS